MALPLFSSGSLSAVTNEDDVGMCPITSLEPACEDLCMECATDANPTVNAAGTELCCLAEKIIEAAGRKACSDAGGTFYPFKSTSAKKCSDSETRTEKTPPPPHPVTKSVREWLRLDAEAKRAAFVKNCDGKGGTYTDLSDKAFGPIINLAKTCGIKTDGPQGSDDACPGPGCVGYAYTCGTCKPVETPQPKPTTTPVPTTTPIPTTTPVPTTAPKPTPTAPLSAK
jgi:hypothetical protein